MEARLKVKPTDEMVLQKARALGVAKQITDPETGQVRTVVPKGFSASQSIEPLDVLLHRSAITPQQYSAAMRLGWIRRATLGYLGPAMMRFQMIAERISADDLDGREMTEEDREDLMKRSHERWREAMDYLKVHAPLSIGPLQCLLDRRWCSSTRLEKAVTGMEMLVRYWRIT